MNHAPLYKKMFSVFGKHSKLLLTFVWGTHKAHRQNLKYTKAQYCQIRTMNLLRKFATNHLTPFRIRKNITPTSVWRKSLNNSTEAFNNFFFLLQETRFLHQSIHDQRLIWIQSATEYIYCHGLTPHEKREREFFLRVCVPDGTKSFKLLSPTNNNFNKSYNHIEYIDGFISLPVKLKHLILTKKLKSIRIEIYWYGVLLSTRNLLTMFVFTRSI